MASNAILLVVEEDSKYINRLQLSKDIIKFSAIALMLIVWAIVSFIARSNKELIEKNPNISSYEECVAAPGSKIQESYPSVCVAVNGKRFVEPITIQQTNSETITSDWKKYISTDQSYTLIYPPDWLVRASESVIEIYYPKAVRLDSYILIESFSDDYSCEKHRDTETKKGEPDPLSIPSYFNEDYIWLGDFIDKKFTYLFRNTFKSDGKIYQREYRLIPHNNICYTIDSYSLSEEYLKTHDQILSMFKFINMINPKWNRHINEEFNFYFEYPKDWEFTEDYYHQRGLSKYSDLLYVSIRPKTMKVDSYWLVRVINDLSVDGVVQDALKENPAYPDRQTELVAFKDITFLNLPAKQLNYKDMITDQYTKKVITHEYSETLLEKDGYIFVLPANSTKNTVMDQVLSTFRFID